MRRKAHKRTGIPLIADMAGVSIGTVDRALHGRAGISPNTLKKVLKIARQIGYKPNTAARALSIGRRLRIGICVPKEIAYFYNELWAGLNEEAGRYSSRGIEFLSIAIP